MSMHTDNRKAMFVSINTKWQTPKYLYNILNYVYKFEYDMAASKKNRLCKKYFSIKDDSLSLDWPSNANLFINPPYTRSIKKWFEKGWDAAKRGSTCVYLVPCRTDTKVFHEWMIRGELFIIKGRVKFIRRNKKLNSAPFPSVVVVFNKKSVERYERHGIDNVLNAYVFDAGIDILRFPRSIKRFPRSIKRFSR